MSHYLSTHIFFLPVLTLMVTVCHPTLCDATCDTVLVQHAGCVNSEGEYICDCDDGYTGQCCETRVSCGPPPREKNAQGDYECTHWGCQVNYTCETGYNGEGGRSECTIDGQWKQLVLGSCEEGPGCASGPCMHGGSCTDELGPYTCACMVGYEGTNCQTEVDECQSQPCANGGICFDLVAGFQCSCVSGFVGLQCENETKECASNPCDNGGVCTDLVGGYHCSCTDGFRGANCQIVVQSCDSHPCQHNGQCNGNVTSYDCICLKGFTGVLCETDINYCASSPCVNGGTCVDLFTGHKCRCTLRYRGVNCEIEKQLSTKCVFNPCANGASCRNASGIIKCFCKRGYSGLRCEIDIDDCESAPCGEGETCSDLTNGFVCGLTGRLEPRQVTSASKANFHVFPELPLIVVFVGGIIALCVVAFYYPRQIRLPEKRYVGAMPESS